MRRMPKFDIAGHRKIWFLISLVLIIPGFICMGMRGFNFGIDFTGGTIMDLRFEQPVTLSDVRASLAKYDLDGSTIQLAGAESGIESSENVMIRTVDLEENQRKEVMASLTQDVGPYTVLREEKVGATIGGELITNAVLALVISWALIILYVAYRFEWRFGVSAVLALVHDIIIVLAVFSLTQRQIDSSFIAALLTIVGYSINATIVIFDRIRENLNEPGGRKNLRDSVNMAVSETLTRSINTSLTTFITVLMLFLFGVSSIRDFTMPLMVGIVSGAWSSVMIAGPLWYDFVQLAEKRKEKAAAEQRAQQPKQKTKKKKS